MIALRHRQRQRRLTDQFETIALNTLTHNGALRYVCVVLKRWRSAKFLKKVKFGAASTQFTNYFFKFKLKNG